MMFIELDYLLTLFSPVASEDTKSSAVWKYE